MINTTVGIETWGGGSTKTKGKSSKLDIITLIAKETRAKALDLSNLNVADLTKILKVAKRHKHPKVLVPGGRLKKPYIDSLDVILPNMGNLTKLSVSSLKNLLEALNNA